MIGGLNKAARYRAVLAKDKRYDGIFYFALKATGIYCRPSCTAPHPVQKNYLFFDTAKQAQAHNYRACSHCHPNRLETGLSVEVLDSIDTGALDEQGVRGLADSLHISERHLRRIVQDRKGVSPTSLNNTRRLAIALSLIRETKLPIIDVAFRADFASLRQFNDVFKDAFKVSPREMRKAALKVPVTHQQTKHVQG